MSSKISGLLKICYRRISRKKTRTIISMLIICVSTILVVGFGSIINTFTNGLNDFGYISVSGIKASGYFKSSVEDSDLYNELLNYSNDIAIKKSYNNINIEDDIFDIKNNSIISINQTYINSSPVKVIKGEFPDNENEIVLPRTFEKLYNEKINISVETNNNKTVSSLKVVGIYDVMNGNGNFRYAIVDMKNTLSEEYGIEYYIYDKNIDNDKMNYIAQKYNVEYVKNPYDGINVTMYIALGNILIFLLVFSLMRNINTIFEKLDYDENKKLRYIGVQKKELFLLNSFYSFFIGILPIIIGNILGIILYNSAMPKILSYTDFSGVTHISINYKLILLTSFIIFLIYFFTLNFNKNEKERMKKYDKLNNIKKVSIEKRYSARSILLNKRKYISIIFSLTTTLSLLIIILVTTMSIDPLKHAQNNNVYNLQITGMLLEDGIDTEIIEEPIHLSKNTEIDYELNYKLYTETETGMQSYIMTKLDKTIKSDDLPIMVEKNRYLTTFSGLGPEYYNYISNKYNIIGEGYSNSGIIYYRPNNTTDNIKLGDTINFEVEINGEIKKIEEKVINIISDKSDVEINYDENLGIFNFSSIKFTELFGSEYVTIIGINSENKEALLELENQLNDDSLYDVKSYESFREIMEKFRLFLVSFGICGSLLLLINSLLNIICTQISNCVTRNKEFATLEAIGCSEGIIKNILIKESYYYLIRSFICSFIIALSSLFYIKSEISFSEKWLIIFICIYIVVVTSIYFINKMIVILNYNEVRKMEITKRINQ